MRAGCQNIHTLTQMDWCERTIITNPQSEQGGVIIMMASPNFCKLAN